MYAKTIDGVWFDVGHPFELIRAQHTLMRQKENLPFPIPNGDFPGFVCCRICRKLRDTYRECTFFVSS